jgi:hypothetical protein
MIGVNTYVHGIGFECRQASNHGRIGIWKRQSYWYTGLTSVGKDESAVGFVLVDTRTKETTFINKVEPLNLLLKVLLKGKFRRKDMLHCLFLIILIHSHL